MRRFSGVAARLVLSLGAMVAGPGWAAEHLVFPGGISLEEIFLSGQVQPGDRIVLAGGRYGEITLQDQEFRPAVTIEPAAGARVVLDRLAIVGSVGLRVRGVTILPETPPAPDSTLVWVDRSAEVVLEGLFVASARSAEGWSKEDWRTRAASGVFLRGRDLALLNSRLEIVDHGVSTYADGARVEGNFIQQFRGDGIRALGHNSQYLNNRIEGCVDVDANHDDGFQSWSLDAAGTPGKGVVRNVVIAGNVVRGGKGDHPFSCDLQGMGFFDGMFENWVIRDNILEVNHWHGITVMGGINVLIENNIVVDETPETPGPPWITITSHKDGRPSSASSIIGNVTQPRAGGGDPVFHQPQPGVESRDNRVVDTPGAAFR